MRAAGIVTLIGFLMPSIAGAANDSGGSPMPAPGAVAETEAAARQADLAEREASSITAQYGCSP